jgi:hypothetical protein
MFQIFLIYAFPTENKTEFFFNFRNPLKVETTTESGVFVSEKSFYSYLKPSADLSGYLRQQCSGLKIFFNNTKSESNLYVENISVRQKVNDLIYENFVKKEELSLFEKTLENQLRISLVNHLFRICKMEKEWYEFRVELNKIDQQKVRPKGFEPLTF